jgi:hypothetical protein
MQGAYFATQPTVQLPPGWQQAYTAEGQVYYVDHTTKTTHWHPPQMPAMAQQQQGYGGHGGGGYGMGGRGGGFNNGAGRGGRVGIDSTKRKTKICMNWESGSCSWGDRCAFAHGASELNSGVQPQVDAYPQQQQRQMPQQSFQ